jgi:hypothetical protein
MPDPTHTSSELPYPVEDILAAIEQVIRVYPFSREDVLDNMRRYDVGQIQSDSPKN